jgi:hypothetical protein
LWCVYLLLGKYRGKIYNTGTPKDKIAKIVQQQSNCVYVIDVISRARLDTVIHPCVEAG